MASQLNVNEIRPYSGNDIQISGSLRISGSGPSKISLEVYGDITASGTITGKEFIVESITSSRIFAEGSSQFGNTLDDKHSFSGSISSPITASHDVSSSSGTGSFQHVYVAEDLQVDGTTILTNLDVNHITASGDISASSQTATHILGGDNITFDLQGNQIFKLNGNLTASGDISSSTTVYAEHLYSADDAEIVDSLIVGGAITSSGDISSSIGNLFANNLTLPSDTGTANLANITASGDISSSGTIIANNFRSSAGGDTSPNQGGINFNDHMVLHGHLTSSNHISQSEGFTGSFGSIKVPRGAVGVGGHVSFDDGNQFMVGSAVGSGFITIQTRDAGQINLSTGRQVVTAGESITLNGSAITASHAISASSTIAEHSIGGKSITLGTGDTGDVTVINLQGNVTASNNFNASGHGVFGTSVSASSHISASGNIFLAGNDADGTNGYISTTAGPFVDIGATNSNGQRIPRIRITNASSSIEFNGNVTASNITASGFISSSGIRAHGEVFALSGFISASGDLFANNLTLPSDTGTLNLANITASGNISSSGTVIGNIGTFTTMTSIDTTNITASGDISSSLGNVHAGVAFRGNHPDATFAMSGNGYIFNEGEHDLNFTYYDNAEDSLIHGDAGLGRLGIGDTSPVSKLDVAGDLNIQSHITASGDISASSQTAVHVIGGDSVTFDLQGNQSFNLKGNMTASGDISASSQTAVHVIGGDSVTLDLQGNQIFHLNGNLTASNNISASGTITGHSGSFEHSSGITGSFGRIEGKAGNSYININDPDEVTPGFAFLTSDLDRLQLGTTTIFNDSQHIGNDLLVKTSGASGTSFRINSETAVVAIGIPTTTNEASASLTVRGHISASGLVVAQGFVPKFKGSNVAAAGSDINNAPSIAVNLGTEINVFVEGADAAKGVQLPSIRNIGLAYSSSIGSAGNVIGPGEGWNEQDSGNPTGMTYMIVNTSDEALLVYPETSQQILPLSANVPVVIPGYNKCEFLLSGSGDHGSWWPFFTSGSTSNAV